MKKSLMLLAGAGGAATMAGGLYLWRRLRHEYESDVLSPEEWEARAPLWPSPPGSDDRLAEDAAGPLVAPGVFYDSRPETMVQTDSMEGALEREIEDLLSEHCHEIRNVWHDLGDEDIRGRSMDDLVGLIHDRTGQESGQIRDRLEELIGRPELTGN